MSDTGLGPLNDAPPLVDVISSNCSWLSPCAPSDQVSTIWLVASVPAGAPLSTSTLGALARSLRAPAMPSITARPMTVSTPPCATVSASSAGPGQREHPSADCYIIAQAV